MHIVLTGSHASYCMLRNHKACRACTVCTCSLADSSELCLPECVMYVRVKRQAGGRVDYGVYVRQQLVPVSS